MTTIVANRSCMAADTQITNIPIFQVDKIFRVNTSIFGIAGDMQQCLKFIEWQKNPVDKLTFADDADFTALELTAKGELFWWGCEMIAIPINEDFYAIGIGAGYALGAMSMGASPQKAVKIASRWDKATGSNVKVMRLKVAR